MNKVLAYGVNLANNFGGPSIVSGFVETLKKVDGECQIAIYCPGSVVNLVLSGSLANIKVLPYNSKQLLVSFFLRKWFGIALDKGEQFKEFWKDFDEADVIVNLYGICFCDKFGGREARVLKRFKGAMSAILQFPLNFMAKIENKRSIKCTASYGPVIHKCTQLAAQFATRFCFDGMIARERESLEVIKKFSGNGCSAILAPDIANNMKCQADGQRRESGKVGISVSFQIVKQWGGDKTIYYSSIRALIEKVFQLGGKSVVLFPNEIKNEGTFDDIAVAKEIKEFFRDNDNVVICNVSSMDAVEIKGEIASCELFVASRYHSCVAALSAGVPLLVIGWHYKYENLMDLYGQSEWLFSISDCTPVALVARFCMFWNAKERIRKELKERLHNVVHDVCVSGDFILGIENGKR